MHNACLKSDPGLRNPIVKGNHCIDKALYMPAVTIARADFAAFNSILPRT
jgi:hypothetical protein